MPSQEGKGGNSLIYQLKFQAQAGHRPLSMVGVSIPLHFLFFAGCKLERPEK